MKPGMSSHQSQKMINDEWLTPPEITKELGPFDLDPCSPVNRPWATAKKHLTIEDNGLLHPWDGFVWCNPPYGKYIVRWMERMAIHKNGIALIFARTETVNFSIYVWNKATSLYFIYGRLHFHYVDGNKSESNSGGPSVLVAYGKEGDDRIKKFSMPGKYIKLR